MLFEEKTLALMDGRTARLRNPVPEKDTAAMIQCLKEMCRETEYLLRYPEECTWTMAQEQGILEEINRSDARLMLVCEVDDAIAGMCGLNFNQSVKTRHRANVDIGLRRRYWGLGIGTAMFEALLDAARHGSVRQVELDYIEGNARARALYEKMGFTQVGVHPDAIMLRDGSFRDLVCMVKRL